MGCSISECQDHIPILVTMIEHWNMVALFQSKLILSRYLLFTCSSNI